MSDTVSSESDIEIRSAPSRKPVKTPISPSDGIINNNLKKTTTKMMIKDALTELKSRKGVSLYAIKKHLTEKFQVNTEKLNFIIKKSIKAGVEDGTFVQLKGIGASGSFKLANVKEKTKPKKKKETEKGVKEIKKKTEPEKAVKEIKKKTAEKTIEKQAEKPMKRKEKEEGGKLKKKVEEKVTKKKENRVEEKGKKSKVKMVNGMPTPAKKRTIMMKRKSIGSIIKPPKMKPKHT